MITLNICLVSKELYPYQKAGIGVYINNLSTMLATHGHTVYIITDYNNELECKTQNERIHVIGVNPYESGEIIEEYSLAYALSVKNKLIELTQKVKIDLIEFADYRGEAYFAILYKQVQNQFQNIPFLLKLHTPTFECYQANELEVPTSSLIQQEDYTIKNVDYVYAISKKMAEIVKNRLGLNKVDVIYNPINLPTNQDELIDLEGLESYVLFVGRYEKRKGLDYFIKSALYVLEQYDLEMKFVIIGQDTVNPLTQCSVKEEIKQLIPEQYRLQFIWIDTVEQTKLMSYYAKALVCVFPSRFEGFGNVCVEAMINGSPVLVSSETGLEEIVDYGKYGAVFQNQNQEDLNQKLLTLLNNNELREKLGKKGRMRAQAFTLEALYEKQITYYESILNAYKQQHLRRISSLEEEVIVRQTNTFLEKQNQYIQLDSSLKEIQKYSENICQENKRLIDEWKKNADYIKVLEKDKNQYYKELMNALKEIERLTHEWQHIYDMKQMLKNQIQDSSYQHKIDKDHIRQLTTQIESVQNEKNRVLSEWEVLRKENERVLKEWEIIAEENQKLKNNYTQLAQELDKLRTDMKSKKYLMKQIICGKKGE